MKKSVIVITTLLLVLPLGMIVYKSQVLNLSLVPQMVDHVWNFHMSLKPKGKQNTLTFPVPMAGPGIKVTDEKIRSKDYDVNVDASTGSAMATWTAKEPIQNRVTYSARIDLKALAYKNIAKDYTSTYPENFKKYLTVPELTSEDLDAITTLENAILEGTEDKTSLIRKIYYYIEEELQLNTDVKNISDMLSTGKGSNLTKAKLFNIMARRKEVPSRVVVLVKMPNTKAAESDKKLTLVFANEVYLNNQWIPIDTNRGHFGLRPDSFLLLHKNFEEVEETISRKNVSYSIHAEKTRINRYNKAEFKKEIAQTDSIFAKFSLYRLPLPLQTMFTTILLIPIGTLVLSLARNIIGIPTFGIFTPILLTLFFKETSFGFGLAFFFIVVLIGIGERYVLDKFYLLAVPRLSIILTLVIMLMLGYTLFSTDITVISQKHLAFFPIVIVTTNIERLSIMIAEEGLVNTLKTLVGTLIIAILGYSLYMITALEMFMFTNPELLFTVIGLLILIGKYKGYRLSEFLRFRDLVRQKKKLESKTP